MAETTPSSGRLIDRSWASPGEAMAIVLDPKLVRRNLLTAVIVGTILSLVNQYVPLSEGTATTATWFRVAANYVVPLIVSSVGALAATRR